MGRAAGAGDRRRLGCLCGRAAIGGNGGGRGHGLGGGVVAMRMVGKAPLFLDPGFEPAQFEPDEDDEVLLLDDRLVEPEADSRVVRLFARPEPTPGELVLRIADYLSEQGKPAARSFAGRARPVDASAALHAALANIRANRCARSTRRLSGLR